MKIQLLSSILVCGILLTGCAGATTEIFRDTEGRIYKVVTKGSGKAVVSSSGGVEHDTKQEPLISLKPELIGGKIGL